MIKSLEYLIADWFCNLFSDDDDIRRGIAMFCVRYLCTGRYEQMHYLLCDKYMNILYSVSSIVYALVHGYAFYSISMNRDGNSNSKIIENLIVKVKLEKR